MSSHTQGLSNRPRTFFADRFRCVYCGKSVLAGDLSILDLTIDHFRPRATGGGNQDRNRVAACRQCNTLKSDNVFPYIEEAASFIAEQRKRNPQAFIENAIQQAIFQEDRADKIEALDW